MRVDMIMGLVIYLLVAFFMIGIGIVQLRSRKPVGFYSGEQPPSEDELTDVHAWNQKHGMMWLCYGGIIIVSALVGTWIGDSIWCTISMCGGVLLPIIIMIWYHHRLVRRYCK